MKPHMAHINNTLVRKKLATDARNVEPSLETYRRLVRKARAAGYSASGIIAELEAEKHRVLMDIRAGDAIFLEGVRNAQNACIVAIDTIISELKGGQ